MDTKKTSSPPNSARDEIASEGLKSTQARAVRRSRAAAARQRHAPAGRGAVERAIAVALVSAPSRSPDRGVSEARDKNATAPTLRHGTGRDLLPAMIHQLWQANPPTSCCRSIGERSHELCLRCQSDQWRIRSMRRCRPANLGLKLWQQVAETWIHTAARWGGWAPPTQAKPEEADAERRFNAPEGEQHPFFRLVKDTGSQGPRRRATRNASVPLIHRATVETAKTAKKRMALAPKMVQKTSKYPTVENHSQSSRKSLASPSAIRQATMTMIATAMPLQRISHLRPASPIVMIRRQGRHCQARSGGSAYDPGPDIPAEIGDLSARTIRRRLSAAANPHAFIRYSQMKGPKPPSRRDFAPL